MPRRASEVNKPTARDMKTNHLLLAVAIFANRIGCMENKYRFIEDDNDFGYNCQNIEEKIFLEILSQLPDDVYWYCGDYVYDLIKDERLLGLARWEIPLDDSYGWYCKRYILNSECKKYLKENLHGNLLSYYFCHHMIKSKSKVYLIVFDAVLFDVYSGINIPQNILDSGESNGVYVSFSDPVEI